MTIPKIIHGNWGLKILAFVLAVVIYYTIHHAIGSHALDGRAPGGNMINGRNAGNEPVQGECANDDRGPIQPR